MIFDHFDDEWGKRLPPPYYPSTPNHEPAITDEEIRQFRDLLERAKEYDIKHNEPKCEMESKKQKLRDLAKMLGIEDKIRFIDE